MGRLFFFSVLYHTEHHKRMLIDYYITFETPVINTAIYHTEHHKRSRLQQRSARDGLHPRRFLQQRRGSALPANAPDAARRCRGGGSVPPGHPR